MQTPSASPFADIITSLAVLHQDQHQAMLDLRADQERRFEAIVRGQQEDREKFRSWIDREDDPEAFVDLFQKAAEACGWPRAQWPVRLIPLLTGEAQAAAQQLPVANLLDYDDLKKAILQRVGRSPEQHRQRFRSLEWGEAGRPFAMAQQLRDSCRRWLLAGGSDVDLIVDLVVLEQFIARLPRKTAEWVQCHRPTSLETAIHLAEDHLVACPGVGAPLLTSRSLSPPSVFPSPPIPLPRSRPPGPPRISPRGRGGMGPGPLGSSRAPPRGAGLLGMGGDSGSGSAPSPRSLSNPLPAAGVAVMSAERV
ncbi:zinc finger protein with KRAB and SCAN domains 7-like [Pseudorasbora parva]|uniref:zinc finger protein with KRAB and SCAN domains 7-like n=1 Tax=Pseudorasbora parva TaxID=51549 RepID=UPI00351F2759